MFDPSPAHFAILAVVVMLLFGAKRLPDAARSLGQSLRIFKAETRGLHEDTAVAPPPPALGQPVPPPVQQVQQVPTAVPAAGVGGPPVAAGTPPVAGPVPSAPVPTAPPTAER